MCGKKLEHGQTLSNLPLKKNRVLYLPYIRQKPSIMESHSSATHSHLVRVPFGGFLRLGFFGFEDLVIVAEALRIPLLNCASTLINITTKVASSLFTVNDSMNHGPLHGFW